MTPFEIFLTATLFVVLALFIFEELRLRSKNNKLVESIVSLSLDKVTLQQELADAPLTSSETEGFIKFLSESREWAFKYIEDVQVAIEALKKAMIENDEAKISEAYTDLMTFLPEKMEND